MRGKRLSYLDMAKGIGIILVLYGHLIYTGEYVRVWISAFHMPLFFVISGITLSMGTKDEKDIKGRIAKKARTLLIPYMWFSIIYFVVDIGNVILNKITMYDFKSNIIATLTFAGKSVMWFITALFISQVILVLLQSKLSDAGVIISVIIIAVISCLCAPYIREAYANNEGSLGVTALLSFPKSIVRSGTVIPYVAAGYYARKYYDKYRFLADKIYIRIIACIVSFGLCVFISITNWAVDTNNIILNNPFLYYAGGMLGSISIISFCALLPSIGILEMVGRYSLVTMAIHLDMYVLWAGLQVGLLVYGICPKSKLLTTVTVIVTLIIGCIAGYIVERFFPFILGRKKRTSVS